MKMSKASEKPDLLAYNPIEWVVRRGSGSPLNKDIVEKESLRKTGANKIRAKLG